MSKKSVKFKKGDIVFTIANSAWGLEPMKVACIHPFELISCDHPTFGRGSFLKNELIPFSKERNRALSVVNALQDVVDQKKKDLFKV